MMSDAEARAVLLGAYELRGLPPPLLGEVQIAQAIARFEGNYGAAFGQANNWGAVQCGHVAPCKPGCVEHTDHHADGTPYQGCFKQYETPELGASDFLHELYRRAGVPEAMREGSAAKTASRMRATKYFEAPADGYARLIVAVAEGNARRMGETLEVRLDPVTPLPWALGALALSAGLLGVGVWKWRR